MKMQVLFIHSAGPQGLHQGSSGLFAYLQGALGADFDVLMAKMPNPENPEYALWKNQLEQELAALNGNVILIGHSLGSPVLLKYLSEETFNHSISGFFSIAAPYWGKDEEWQREDFNLPANFAANLPPISQMFLYHSHNDEIVPFEHLEHYKEKLPQATVRAIDGKEHLFNDGLPELVNDIKSL